ncbi:MAG TPA: ABC transporter ATP-binding protein [Candidatus Omnitrophota bacterium]|nr:ABC transporter ATP-binding protein [Candidatus Omnitrophota bacterium]HPN88353.1 ABC transporter ATP-binding protein [Candidatus Omnitrophota bacterium]
MNTTLVTIKDLTVSVKDGNQKKYLIEQINFDIIQEHIVSLVGESGSGKTTTALCLGRLLSLALTIESGKIIFNGQDFLTLTEKQLQQFRGAEIGFIFQEPLYAFNPLLTIGFQIEEVLIAHSDRNRKQRQSRVLELLDMVRISDPMRVFRSYPHQLSGGMRQRAMIAQAIAASPKLIIADEPTSNLDVTLQAEIIELFQELNQKLHLAILLITHDLGLVRHLSDDLVVMKSGRIVEKGRTKDVLAMPRHSYTQELLEATH